MGIINTAIESASANDLQNLEMAKRACGVLAQHYPNHMWKVLANTEGGTLAVFNLMLSAQMGYVVKLPETYSSSELDKRVMLAGGEVLERYNLARGGFNQFQYDALRSEKGKHIVSL